MCFSLLMAQDGTVHMMGRPPSLRLYRDEIDYQLHCAGSGAAPPHEEDRLSVNGNDLRALRCNNNSIGGLSHEPPPREQRNQIRVSARTGGIAPRLCLNSGRVITLKRHYSPIQRGATPLSQRSQRNATYLGDARACVHCRAGNKVATRKELGGDDGSSRKSECAGGAVERVGVKSIISRHPFKGAKGVGCGR